MGCEVARASALILSAAISALPSRAGMKSLSALPDFSCTRMAICTPSHTSSATCSKSASVKPREVSAAVPMRTPPGISAEVSPATEFLLSVIDASSNTFSALEPVSPAGRRSQRTRWLSVPPEMSTRPLLTMRFASAAQFFFTCNAYAANSGVAACLSATHSAAIVWLWGPPWSAGNTAWLMRASRSYSSPFSFLPRRKKMMPERGPRRVLCVVEVTTSAQSKGESTTPPATSPEMCAMSTIMYAPTLSQMARKRL
mmetsp:Transcript_19598/g.47454  ORF Transcript_19598/g.47454 Transcript_19598/m.47454 type:complete len:256 (-) Transcript_19598:610-1377(-)